MCAERVTRSAGISRTSTGMCPADAVASTWNVTPASFAIRPIGPTGSIVPISELACITERSAVSARSAFRTASGSTTPFRSTGKNGHLVPRVAKRDQCVHHGEVLDFRHDDVPLPGARALRRAEDGEVVRLGGSRGEDDLSRLRPDQRRDLGPRLVDRPQRRLPLVVDVGGRVAVPFEEVRTHRLEDAGVEGGGRYMVEKGLRHRIVRAPRFTA